MKPTAIVLTGDGINCGEETAFAFEISGFDALPYSHQRFAEQSKAAKVGLNCWLCQEDFPLATKSLPERVWQSN